MLTKVSCSYKYSHTVFRKTLRKINFHAMNIGRHSYSIVVRSSLSSFSSSSPKSSNPRKLKLLMEASSSFILQPLRKWLGSCLNQIFTAMFWLSLFATEFTWWYLKINQIHSKMLLEYFN